MEQFENQNAKVANPHKEFWEWMRALVTAVILVFIIRWLVLSPFIVDGPSMQPNFFSKERIIVNKLLYKFRSPQRGEVIVFHVPEQGRDFIKRVIALPGETVRVEGDKVYINDRRLKEPYLQAAYDQAHKKKELYNRYDGEHSNFPNEYVQETTVPEGKVFVMGDNRANSEDSRMIGYISKEQVVGRADLIFWPLNHFQFVRAK